MRPDRISKASALVLLKRGLDLARVKSPRLAGRPDPDSVPDGKVASLTGMTPLSAITCLDKVMLKLCRAFGFTVKSEREDPGVMYVSLKL